MLDIASYEEKLMSKVWTSRIEADENGDLILPLPPELIAELGWKVGDTIVWDIDEEANIVTLSKKGN